jgi:hypothetical protein
MAAAVTGRPLEPRRTSVAQPVPPGAGTTFEGNGAMMTPPFALAEGEAMFRFEPATLTATYYRVSLQDMDGSETVLFEGTEAMLRELKQPMRAGVYRFDVRADGEWSIKVTVAR